MVEDLLCDLVERQQRPVSALAPCDLLERFFSWEPGGTGAAIPHLIVPRAEVRLRVKHRSIGIPPAMGRVRGIKYLFRFGQARTLSSFGWM